MALNQGPQRAAAVVLLVESNARKRAAKATDLRQAGFEVFQAADATGAKAILNAMVVDVVFSDID
jgi:DNA-binding response OmpR family regulator